MFARCSFLAGSLGLVLLAGGPAASQSIPVRGLIDAVGAGPASDQPRPMAPGTEARGRSGTMVHPKTKVAPAQNSGPPFEKRVYPRNPPSRSHDNG
jgi:hypothetical protein